MTQNKRFAVTGGIGSGKSAVLQILDELGYPVFSCDEIYRELCGEREFLARIEARFPGSVKGDVLDRRALSRLVFSDPEARAELNAITHPSVMERLLSRMEQFPVSFAEVPLLFEGGFEKLFDGVLTVIRDKRARIEAIGLRDGLSEEEILLRMAGQYDWDEPPSNVVPIENNGSREELVSRTREALSALGL